MQYGPYDLTLLPDPTVQGRVINPINDVLMAETLMYNKHFATDRASGDLYVYNNGVYGLVDKEIYQAISELCKSFGIKWSTRHDNSIVDYIKKHIPHLEEKPNPKILNLRNGWWYIYEKRFESHEEGEHWKQLTTIQLPVDYNPNAMCINTLQFLDEVFPQGSDLLIDVIGLCMTSDTTQHKAIILLGDGNNGKSVFLYGLRSLVGRENSSSTTIHELCDSKNRFANDDLVGKLVNCSDDTPQGPIMDTANMKSIVSGNPIRVEGKFKKAVSYTPFCKLVFGTNHRLTSEDETAGYMRRLFHIPFTKKFGQNPKKEKELHEMFQDEEEKSGILNEVLKRLHITLREGFQIPDAVRDIVETYDPIPDDSSSWIANNLEIEPGGKIEAYRLHVTYMYHTERTSDSAEQISRFIFAKFPGIKKARARINGKIRQCYIGVKWKTQLMEDFAASGVAEPEEVRIVEEPVN